MYYLVNSVSVGDQPPLIAQSLLECPPPLPAML